MKTKPTIGILGAGKLGTTLGKVLLNAGYPVLISGSGSADKIKLTTSILLPGSEPLSSEEVSEQADIVVLALPLSKYKDLDPQPLENKLVIDAMNYWWEVDGLENIYSDENESSSEKVQAYFTNTTVVKAFNHMGYHDLGDHALPETTEGRKAIMLAGEDEGAIETVEEIIDNVGFTALYIGELKNGVILEPGSPLFGASLGLEESQELVNTQKQEMNIKN